MALLLVESTILDRRESALGILGTDTSIESGAGSMGADPLSTAELVPPKLGAVGRAWVGSVSSWRLTGAVVAWEPGSTGTIAALLGRLTRFIASVGTAIRCR